MYEASASCDGVDYSDVVAFCIVVKLFVILVRDEENP